MTRISLLAGLALLGTTGCLSGPYDGTWLFMLDNSSADAKGDCEPDPDADYEVSYEGTSNALVDIYTTPDSGIVVLFGDALYGSYEGSSFDAESEQLEETRNGDYAEAYRQGYVMDGTVAGGVMEGEIEQFYEAADNDGYSYDCSTTFEYTAERVTSGSSRYPED